MKKLSQLSEAYSDEILDLDTCSLIIEKLKNALKEELNAWYGYVIVKEFLTGSKRTEVVKLYEETAKDELEDHAFWLMKRINELGGSIEDITISPASWLTANHTYIAPKWENKYSKEKDIENGDIVVPVQESLFTNIQNENGAIETYRDLIETARISKDYTTERKCKEILADEEEHLQLLKEFLDDLVVGRREIDKYNN